MAQPRGVVLVQLYPPPPESGTEADADIIAIHGLDTKSPDTWTWTSEDRTVNWLIDLLPSKTKSARIFTCDWPADLLEQVDLMPLTNKEFARRLLAGIRSERTESETDENRPVLFIASCLGGIILMQALVLAAQHDSEYNPLWKATCGIVFLATPFRGTAFQEIADAADFWLKGYAALTKRVVSNLLGNVKGSTADLEELVADFTNKYRQHPERLSIFYETGKSNLLRKVIPCRLLADLLRTPKPLVDSGSARLDMVQNPIPLKRTHVLMNKFQGGDDDGEYQLVAGKIVELLRKAREQRRKLDPTDWPKLDLPTAEGAEFDSRTQEHNTQCHPATRIGLLNDIKQWVGDPKGSCIFWLNGRAGTGKSTISRTVASYFDKQQSLGASFFFKRGEQDRGDANRLFTTIASQLNSKVPGLRHHLRNALKKHPHIHTKALQEQFEKLILQPLGNIDDTANPITIIIVIDALDECDGNDDIKRIIFLFSQAKDLKSVRLRIFITSRPDLPIRLGFKRIDKYDRVVLHEIPNPVIRDDITAYLQSELAKIRDHYNDIALDDLQLPPSWPEEHIIQTLVGMAMPLFIFAATACRFLNDPAENPQSQLEKIIGYQNRSFDELDTTYLPILDQLVAGRTGPDKSNVLSKFQTIIGSIVLLTDPLSISSLSRLLRIGMREVENILKALHSVLDIPSSSGGLVRIFHLSFRDFLTDPTKQNSDFWVNEKEAHEKIATHCRCLLDSSLKEDICSLKTPGKARKDVDPEIIKNCLPPEVQYACLSWVHHLKESSVTIQDEGQEHQFLQRNFLHWLEALSLMGRLSYSVRMITDLQDMTVGTDMKRFLQDAQRFVLYFLPAIMVAPLQAYYSGVVFAPKASIVRQVCMDGRPSWIKTLPLPESDWSPCVATLEGHSNSVNSVAFSGDGRQLASASWDRTVKIWDPATGVCLSTLKGHSNWVSSVAFSGDGRQLASASRDNTVKIWDPATGVCLSTLKGHSNSVNSVAFSGDGRQLASASDDNTVKIWDPATGVCLSTLKGHSNSVNSVAFSVDGRQLASASDDNTVKIWDPATGVCLSTLEGHSNSVSSVAFSGDGRQLASASWDNTVKIWDPATGVCLSTLKGHSNWVNSVAFSGDGRQLASASWDNTVKIWDPATGVYLSTLKGHSNSVSSVAFSVDGRQLASASWDSTVKTWDPATGVCLPTLKGHSNSVNSVAFSGDGRQLASASWDNTVKIWDPATGVCLSTLKGHSNSVSSVAFSGDGRQLASASRDSTIKIWDPATGVCLSTLKGHSNSVNSVAFSGDGRQLASASWDNTVKIWDPATGVCLSTLKGHSNSVSSVAFSGDGRQLASASRDSTVKIWDPATGQCCQTLDTGRSLDTLEFDATDSCLLTAIGTFIMDIPTYPGLSAGKLVQNRQRQSYGITDDGAWIIRESENLLWLPPEYRPGTSAVKGSVVTIGCAFGRVLLFRFTNDHSR